MPNPLKPEHAAVAVLAAVASDSKTGNGAAIERGRFAILIAAMAAACLIAGGVGFAVTLVFIGV